MSDQLELKLLGFKRHNYCDESNSDSENESVQLVSPNTPKRYPSAVNTGPKGVLEDERQYRSMLRKASLNDRRDTIELLKKVSLNCNLDEDSIFKEYCQNRLSELYQRYNNMPIFGMVTDLNVNNFASSIDNEKPDVTIIVYIYSNTINECLNSCFSILAKRHINQKFCKLNVGEGQIVSRRFKEIGCPAIVSYKNGNVLGSILNVNDQLGDDFYVDDLDRLFIDHKIYCPFEKVLKIVDK